MSSRIQETFKLRLATHERLVEEYALTERALAESKPSESSRAHRLGFHNSAMASALRAYLAHQAAAAYQENS